MSKILEALDSMAQRPYYTEWAHPAIRRFVQTGDSAQLAAIPVVQYRATWDLQRVLMEPDLDAKEVERVLVFCLARKVETIIEAWLQQYSRRESSNWELFEQVVQQMRTLGATEEQLRWWLRSERLRDADGTPNPPGRFILQASDNELTAMLQNHGATDLPALLAVAEPEKLTRLLDAGVRPHYEFSSYAEIIRANPAGFHERFFAMCQNLKHEGAKESLLTVLATVMPEKYRSWACEEAKKILLQSHTGDSTKRSFCCFLLSQKYPEALSLTVQWIEGRNETLNWNSAHQRQIVLTHAEEIDPTLIPPLAEACTHCKLGSVILLGLRYWKAHAVGDLDDRYLEALRRSLHCEDSGSIVLGITEARDWNLQRMQPDIWPLMQHKSRPVRGAAARALAGLGYAGASERALKLLEHKKADVRQTAVMLLSQIGGEQALKVLKQRLDVEENDDVRDSILLALERGGGAAAFSPAEQQARIAKTLAKSKAAPATWIKAEALDFKRRDGSALTSDEVLYLLIRQSRCKDMRADLEAKPLYGDLDRASCADSALALLQAFLGSGQDAADRWVLALAALTGDDRLVPVLRKAILDWADNSRGKLAEYAAQALALLGTDAALMVVDSLSVRFRSKNKNIGQAAADAFAAAAEARGVTVEELGDLVVPWLGFEPGKPRLIVTSKGQVEARIDAELKLSFRDVKTGKALAKLPAGATAEVQAEFKTLTGTLKEAVKAQLLRIETLLVRQFRWPVSRWSELYLSHPLLRPFTQRLVWGWRDDAGVLQHTFRALEDATLTDVENNAVALQDGGSLSLVHPLDLSDEARAAWLQHLADYNISPPFAQLDRPVVRVKAEEAATKFGKQIAGTALNAMTFRSRAEKLGWSRGSVCDAGGVTGYRKIFTGAGVEAFLALEGMYVGIGMDESITLGDVFLVKSGSVQVGSYIYDEPCKDDDPRLIAFADVPAVPFSEVMGDLVKISGKAGETAETPVE